MQRDGAKDRLPIERNASQDIVQVLTMRNGNSEERQPFSRRCIDSFLLARVALELLQQGWLSYGSILIHSFCFQHTQDCSLGTAP